MALLAAIAARATVWPFEIAAFVPGATFMVGWAVYREPGGRGGKPGRRIAG